MKFKTQLTLFFAFFALLTFFSCEDEPIDSNMQNQVETILPNSDLADMMQDVSSVDSFDCVDFQYPISFIIYNANFQVVETVSIESDADLLTFMQGLAESDNGVVLASLNFPVSLNYGNGTTVEVSNNLELEAALNAASDNCGDASSCDFDTVRDYLVSCPQVPTLNGHTPSFTYFEFFDSNELFTMYELDLPHSGTWDIAMIEGELHVFINFNGLENYNGEYVVMDCSDTTLVLQQGENTLILTKDCNNVDNPFECFGSFDAEISLCDEMNDGTEVFDLTQAFVNCTTAAGIVVTYHQSETNAQASINAISNPTTYSNVSVPQTIYVRVELIADGNYQIFPIQLILENCDCDNPATLTDDLIIYMPFGNQAKDLVSGNEISNVANTFVEDRNGNPSCAIAFDGTNALYFPVSDQNQLVQGDSFSVSVWFKMQNDTADNFETLFQKGEAVTEGFQLSVYDINTPVFSDSSYGYGLWDQDWNQQVDVAWDNTDWHHLVVTVDANNTVRLYRDGVLRNTDENSNINIGTSSLQNYILGAGFVGHLDDLRVYGKALNPNEISVLYNLPGDCYQCF